MKRIRGTAASAILATLFALGANVAASAEEGMLVTVTGPIDAKASGFLLPHEHLMSTFRATEEQAKRYNRDTAFVNVLPFLQRAKALGLETIADCTAAYFGRDPVLLRRLSEATGVHVLTNTGYYGAAGDIYVPDHAYDDTVDELAARWIREARDGIDGTGIKPGFIKIGVNGKTLSEIDAKLVRAAARTHLATGLTIAAHTGGNTDLVRGQMAILEEEGVSPSAWIWVHAQNVKDPADAVAAGRAGAWVEFDGVRESTLEKHLDLVKTMKEAGLLGRVLLSHDGNTYYVRGSEPKLYEALMTAFIPRLRAEGFSDAEIRLMTQENPARALAVGVRKAKP